MKKYTLIRDKEYSKYDVNSIHVATQEEYEGKLYDKLHEILFQFVGEPNINDFCEMLETMDAIRQFFNFDINDIKKIKTENFKQLGGYTRRYVYDEKK